MVFFHRRLSHSSRDQLGYYEILCRGDNLFKYWGLLSTFPGLLSTTYKVCIIHHQKVYCGYTADNHNGQLLLWAHLVEMETAVRGWKGYWNRHSQINGPNHNSFFISPSFFIHSIWLSILIKTCDYINICVFFTPVRREAAYFRMPSILLLSYFTCISSISLYQSIIILSLSICHTLLCTIICKISSS